MRRGAAVLVGSAAVALLVGGSLGGCGQDAAGGAAPAPVTSTSPVAEPEGADVVPAYPTLPAVVVRGEGEMPPPTDDQRQLLEEITTHGLPDATMADVQRQEVLISLFDAVRAMPGWAWSDIGTGSGDGQGWDASVAFAGPAPQEVLDVLRALPVDVRVVQGVLLTEGQRDVAQNAACDVVLEKPGGIESGSCGIDQESLLISIDYSGQEAPEPAALQERALAAAQATVQDPAVRSVLDIVVTHRDEPVAEAAQTAPG